jgi:hypothetical protein
MSEAELHIIRARLDGGIRNKAARGELRRGVLAGDFFVFPVAGAAGAACGATSADRRCTTAQIRTTANFRLVNFFTGFRSSNGATPAKLFQVSTRREAGQSGDHASENGTKWQSFENASALKKPHKLLKVKRLGPFLAGENSKTSDTPEVYPLGDAPTLGGHLKTGNSWTLQIDAVRANIFRYGDGREGHP